LSSRKPREKQRRKNWYAYLLGGPVALADVLAILQPGEDLLDHLLLYPGLLELQTLTTHAGLLLLVLKSLLDELDILEPQLLLDNVEITSGVDITLDVNNLSIVEATNNLEDGIDGTNVRKEGVAETGTSGRTARETSNIVDGQVSRDDGLGLVFLNKPIEAFVGDDDARLLGFDGGIGEIL
jgi:hypothetical protein